MMSRMFFLTKYILYAIFATTVYGCISYFSIYKQFAGLSLLYTYVGNMVMIILSLTLDSIIHGVLQSKDFVLTKKNYRFARFMYMDSYVSFRTTVYLFYIIILVVSQVLSFIPTPVNEDIEKFTTTIEYGIILVIAFDALIASVFKDMDRIVRISAKFRDYLSDKKD